MRFSSASGCGSVVGRVIQSADNRLPDQLQHMDVLERPTLETGPGHCPRPPFLVLRRSEEQLAAYAAFHPERVAHQCDAPTAALDKRAAYVNFVPYDFNVLPRPFVSLFDRRLDFGDSDFIHGYVRAGTMDKP